MAARHDSIIFNNKNGYGSTGLFINIKVLITTHSIKTDANIPMNFQLPPNSATLSAVRSPNVVFFPNRASMRLTKDSWSTMLLITSLSSLDTSPFSVSRTPCIYSSRNFFRESLDIYPFADTFGYLFLMSCRRFGRNMAIGCASDRGIFFPVTSHMTDFSDAIFSLVPRSI